MPKQKIGANLLKNMGELGLNELRNAVAYEGNVQDDIRRTSQNPQRELNHFHYQMPQQDQEQSLDLGQER